MPRLSQIQGVNLKRMSLSRIGAVAVLGVDPILGLAGNHRPLDLGSLVAMIRYDWMRFDTDVADFDDKRAQRRIG